jgi:hypothetical protein
MRRNITSIYFISLSKYDSLPTSGILEGLLPAAMARRSDSVLFPTEEQNVAFSFTLLSMPYYSLTTLLLHNLRHSPWYFLLGTIYNSLLVDVADSARPLDGPLTLFLPSCFCPCHKAAGAARPPPPPSRKAGNGRRGKDSWR